tara:strand:+ start:5191 stop:5523 length:333 start_codon:yes stop_codon:yes gene_type:complete
MANNTYSSDPLLGTAVTYKSSTPDVRVGTVVKVVSDVPALQGKFAMYVRASGEVGNSSYVTIALGSVSCLATSVNAGAAGTALCRNGSVAFDDAEYGWVYVLQPNQLLGG